MPKILSPELSPTWDEVEFVLKGQHNYSQPLRHKLAPVILEQIREFELYETYKDLVEPLVRAVRENRDFTNWNASLAEGWGIRAGRTPVSYSFLTYVRRDYNLGRIVQNFNRRRVGTDIHVYGLRTGRIQDVMVSGCQKCHDLISQVFPGLSVENQTIAGHQAAIQIGMGRSLRSNVDISRMIIDIVTSHHSVYDWPVKKLHERLNNRVTRTQVYDILGVERPRRGRRRSRDNEGGIGALFG